MKAKRQAQPIPSTVTVHVPLTFTLPGGRKTIIGEVPYTAPRTRFDDSITKALARAHRWRSLIEDRTYASITELAKEKGVNQSYACRLLRLTLLAPQIVEAVLDRRGTSLTLGTLMRPLSSRWDDQRTALASQLTIAGLPLRYEIPDIRFTPKPNETRDRNTLALRQKPRLTGRERPRRRTCDASRELSKAARFFSTARDSMLALILL